MAEFVCKVGDATGRVFQQVENAQSEAEVRQRLADKGFYVYSVRAHLGLLTQLRQPRTRVLKSADFLIFNQQFNTLIKAGLPILKALELLSMRAAAPKLRPMLTDVFQRVRDGAFLSEALRAQGLFPVVYTTAVMAGEKSGNLSGVLDQYISYQRTTTSFRNRLVTVMIYPCILVVTVILVLSFLVTYAVPKFADLYSQLNIPLPVYTRILLEIALPLRKYVLLGLGLAALGVVFLGLWTRTMEGGLAVDRVKPKLPVVGDIWVKSQIAQFVRTLATLLAGGTPLVSALETSADAISSKLISSAVHAAAERVRTGQSLHSSLAETRLIPDLALEMIEVGEASGALSPMLISVAEFYEEEVGLRLTRILTWIQPAVIVVMALVVLFILVALYLPMFSLNFGALQGQ